MKQLILFSILLLANINSNAQKSRIQYLADSLIAETKVQSNDTNQCIRYCTLSSYYRQLDTDTAIKWAYKGIELSRSLQYNNGLKCAYNNLGIALYTQTKYKEAIEAFEQYKTICLTQKDPKDIAWAYNNIGNVYIDLTEYSTTLLYYDSALTVRKQLNDSGAIAQSLINFGYVYKELGNYTAALINLFQALKILEQSKEESALAYCYDFIGSVYSLRKNYNYSNFFYQKALVLYLKNNQRSGEAIALNTIGTNYYALGNITLGKSYLNDAFNIYSELDDTRQLAILSSTLSEIYSTENKPDSALILAQQSIHYHLKSDNKRQLGIAYQKLAHAQILLHKYSDALLSATKAYELTESNGEQNSKQAIAQTLSELYAKKGDYNKAYTFQKIHEAIKDSIINIAGEKAIAELQTKYETEKKDLAIEKQGIELKRKQTQLQLSLISIISILILGFLFYNRYKIKQKALLTATLLEEQSIRTKAIVEAEEKERIRIARELHDGIGQQLSAAKMNLSAFESTISETNKDSFQTILQLVDDAVKEVRSVSHNMMPNALIRSGLASAVRDFIHKISINDSLKIDLEIIGLKERLEPTTETVLYRVLQECMSNIIKHAYASVVTIQLIKHSTHLSLLIEDNGKGFDTKNINQVEGIGLKNIISRIEFLNGTVEFDSTINRGTTIIIDIPLA